MEFGSQKAQADSKHAYLILAHNEWGLLEKLLHLLDDCRNDIFLHIDIKAVAPSQDTIREWVKKARLYFVQSRNILWGSYAMVDCEIGMLTEVMKTKEKYSYIHLISGCDLPIKTQDWIHDHLNHENPVNYISCQVTDSQSDRERIDCYHFMPIVNTKVYNVFRKADSLFLRIQRVLHIHRLRKEEIIYKGHQWFSIKYDFAQYILENKLWIERTFKHSLCADELVLQMLIMRSPFAATIGKNALRTIDWSRHSSHPETYRLKDYGAIMSSDGIFARKFSEVVDKEIVEKIYDAILNNINPL